MLLAFCLIFDLRFLSLAMSTVNTHIHLTHQRSLLVQTAYVNKLKLFLFLQKTWPPGTQCVAKSDHTKPKPNEIFYRKGDILTILGLELLMVRLWVLFSCRKAHIQQLS